jgi:hypothetical protein
MRFDQELDEDLEREALRLFEVARAEGSTLGDDHLMEECRRLAVENARGDEPPLPDVEE